MVFVGSSCTDEFRRLEDLKEKFERVENLTGVPSDILKAISYTLTRYYHHLPKSPEDVKDAERFSEISVERIINDEYYNILAGALLLRRYLEICGGDLKCALKSYGGEILARDVLNILKNGLDYPVLSIKPYPEINLEFKDEEPIKPNACPPGPEYPLVNRWVPAHPSNYTSSNRPSSYPITKIIVHTTQGSYAGAISWFQNPSSNVSARYVLRSSDGEATQMVCHKDIAWHAGNWFYNTRSIGLEHEGYVSQNGWYTNTVLRHDTVNGIMGHVEIPGATHTDPGPYWDWLYYLALVEGLRAPDTLVDNLTSGFRRGGPYQYWWFDSGNGFGTVYSLGNYTGSVVNWGRWTPNLPRSGFYEVKVYIPLGYNAYVRYRVYHRGGVTNVWVNQASCSNQWVSLGTYEFDAGYSPSNSLTRKIAFDAAVWIYRGSPCADVIVDDGDTGWYPFGNWYLSSYTGYDGDCRYANVGGTPDSAIWTSSLSCSGSWKIYAWVRKGTNRTTQAKYRVGTISGDTILYLNQYSIYLGEVCTDTFLVTLYDQAPDEWNGSTCYTDLSEEDKKDMLELRIEEGKIVVMVPTKGNLRVSVYSTDGRKVLEKVFRDARGLVEQPLRIRGVYFVVVEFEGMRKVKKVMLKP